MTSILNSLLVFLMMERGLLLLEHVHNNSTVIDFQIKFFFQIETIIRTVQIIEIIGGV